MSLTPSFRIGSIAIDAPTALAPMAALTDTVFRRMIKRQQGCGFLITEMVPAKAFLLGCRRSHALLRYAEEERPIGGQLMGADPAMMAEAARALEAMGFDFIDVNMGCPARKVVSGGGGSALMREPAQAAAVVDAMTRAVAIPITVKLRAGWDDSCLNAPDVAAATADVGAAMVSVHARTRSEQYRPGIRGDILTQARQRLAIPLIANGDIRTADQARELLAATGCDGVMAGRGAVANPWLLREIATGDVTTPSAERARRWILDHFAILREELEPLDVLSKLKTFSGWYTRGLMQGAALRQRIGALQTPDEFVDAIEEFFAASDALTAPPPRLAVNPHQVNRP